MTIQPPSKSDGSASPPSVQFVTSQQPRSPARPSGFRGRHKALLLSFIGFVVIPACVIAGYLYCIAADQFASRVGFSVRSEEAPTTSELLGGLTALSSGTTKDSDVLYEFIGSQNIIEEIKQEIDLETIYRKPQFDPYFTYKKNGTIEDLVEYWERMVKVDYDASTGLIEIRTNAFTSEDAHLIATKIFQASSRKINELSAIARDDITRYSRDELNTSVERLTRARQDIAQFRNDTQIVDPSADIESQMGLLTSLQQSLSEALIELDLLQETTIADDPRIRDGERKIEVIRKRIDEERRRFGRSWSDGTGGDFSSILSKFEELSMSLDFAQESYLLALASYDAAQAKSRRQSRYLAAYIEPTRSQRAEYPKRFMLSSLAALYLSLGWLTLVLIYYSLRDRR